jgi:hypothetical protein
MDPEERGIVVRNRLSRMIALSHCHVCGYMALDGDEELTMMRTENACPHCGVRGESPRQSLVTHSDLIDWIAEYAISELPRDHAASVVLFCALGDALQADLVNAFGEFHPEGEKRRPQIRRFEVDAAQFQEVFGKDVGGLLGEAPEHLRAVGKDWKELKGLRNRFVHGGSWAGAIKQKDALRAVDAILPLTQLYIWLNNTCCIGSGRRGPTAG